ncbi:MAG: dehydrogenase E1 component subunit alpha/beta [Bacteroidota bacterium]
MNFERRNLSDAELLSLYKQLRFPRMIEEKMLVLLRQGRISKWFSGIGQEAISVGVSTALESTDYLLPLHRNLGVFTTRQLPLYRLICQWLGKADGYTQGRDRSFHFASPEDRIIGMISHLGAMLPVADGLALSGLLEGNKTIAAAFSGDGGTSEGDFHEALNVAAVWDLPVIFVIENNGYGLSTPTSEQYRCKKLSDRARGYGIKGVTIDGNNVLEVYHTVKDLSRRMRKKPQPVLLECQTFRMRGHEEASGTKYVPQHLFEEWKVRDPLSNYEEWLIAQGILSEEEKVKIITGFKQEIQEAVDRAWAAPVIEPHKIKESQEVFKDFAVPQVEATGSHQSMRMVDAIQDGLRVAMETYPDLVLMGQDIAEYGGVFKITQGFVEQFGKERVRNTPICESAIIGTGLGLSLGGHRAMVEMQFADFVSCAYNQIVNNLAKTHYRWGHAPNVVVRMPTGAGVGAGPYHSQSNEAWFTQVAGLKVIYPSTPEDAKGLLLSSFADPNPILFFEHKALYRSLEAEVAAGYYTLPIGKARIVQTGEEATIITYGLGVHWAKEIVQKLEADVEIVDLRTLIPWDRETVFDSVKKTGKCLVLHEDALTGGFGGEIAASVGEHCFEWLDAPVMRLGSMDTPIPFHPELEKQYLAKSELEEKLEDLLGY